MALKGTLHHPKTFELGVALDMPTGLALGVLEGLWDFARHYAPDGAIGKYPNRAIAEHMLTGVEPERLIAALVECRWLDRVDGPDRLVVHDWSDFADTFTRKKLATRGIPFAKGSDNRRGPGRPKKLQNTAKETANGKAELQTETAKTEKTFCKRNVHNARAAVPEAEAVNPDPVLKATGKPRARGPSKAGLPDGFKQPFSGPEGEGKPGGRGSGDALIDRLAGHLAAPGKRERLRDAGDDEARKAAEREVARLAASRPQPNGHGPPGESEAEQIRREKAEIEEFNRLRGAAPVPTRGKKR